MFSAIDLIPLLPTLVLACGACVLLLSEAFLVSGDRRYQVWIAAASALAAFALAVSQIPGPSGAIFRGAARADAFQAFIAAVCCAGLFISLLLSVGFLRRIEAERGEFYALMLFATSGMALLAMASDLIMIFVALEIMSVSTYALAAYLRRGQRSTESAFKYFLLGAFSSALYLYGAALTFGATGTTRLDQIASVGAKAFPSLMAPAVALIAVGFAFKVAAVPFHMWAPDVYEGAPTPVTAFMAVGVKAAAFAAFFRLLAVGFAGMTEQWSTVIVVLAIITMLLGNLLALPQRNVKRMLAYSSIAHAGYAMVGLAAASVAQGRVIGGQGMLFYLAAYTVTAAGAFGVAAAVERKEIDAANAWDLERFAGLGRRRPVLAFFMAVFMLSLAGIPTTSRFIGKLLVFRAALDAGLVSLAIIGVITSAIGAYYYLRVVVYMYFRSPEGAAEPEPRSAVLDWGLGLACVLVFVLGLGPGFIAEAARRGAAALF